MHSICSKNPGFCDLINCLCIYNLAWFRTTLFSWWSCVANCLQDVCSDSYELNIRLASNLLLVCYQWLLLESKPPFLFTVNKMNELDAVLKLWVKVSKLSLKIPCWWFNFPKEKFAASITAFGNYWILETCLSYIILHSWT